MGSVAPVQARVLGLEDAECVAVAMPAGPAAVAVGLSAQARSGGGARVEYLGAAQVEAVVPESGPAAGGSPLRLLGRELPSRGARCRVGGGPLGESEPAADAAGGDLEAKLLSSPAARARAVHSEPSASARAEAQRGSPPSVPAGPLGAACACPRTVCPPRRSVGTMRYMYTR